MQENKYAEIRARVTLDLDFRGEMHVVTYDITGNPFQPLSHNLDGHNYDAQPPRNVTVVPDK